MADITVQPHGDRWAVTQAGDASPLKEFETREAAELAARQMVGDGRVEVREDDPSGLDEAETTRDPRAGLDEVNAVTARERARSVQTGL